MSNEKRISNHPHCSSCTDCGHEHETKCFNDFPNFCPPPSRPPIPCNPPVPSVVQGMSLYEAVNNLTNRVNVCINTYNDVMRNCYETLHNLEKAAEENGAYYSPCDVYTEEGYSADEGATYTLIHKNVVDRRGEPIRVKLHLAYGNTTNSKIQQDLFSASKITYADKIVVAQPMGENGWYGKTIWNGCPIPGANEPSLYTMGFTRSGVMKVYNNSVSTDQMMRDTIENAMGVSGVLIMNGQITDESYTENIPNAKEQTARVCIGQNLDTREVIFLVCGNENNVNKKGLTTKACANILLQYGCDIAVELCEGTSAGAMDKGSLMFVPENNEIPNAYCFWYISRACFYNSDYERELAELMQNYGQCIWNTYLNKKDIDTLKTDLENEINDRIAADNELKAEDERIENKLDEEIANRTESDEQFQTAITELQTRLEKAESDIANLKSLYNKLQEQTSTMDEAITSIQTTITSIETSLNNLKQTVENIRNGTIQLNYLSLSGGTMSGSINMNSNKITNLPEPSVDNDAATKYYVDNHIAGGGDFMANGSIPATGDFNMNNHKIIGLATPTETTDAATKQYVDSTVSSAGGGDFMANGSIPATGDFNMGSHKITALAEPTTTTDAATKQYVDNAVSGAGGGDFKADGSIPATGNFDMANHKITNVATPTETTDVANKSYVDNADFLPLTGGTLTGDLKVAADSASVTVEGNSGVLVVKDNNQSSNNYIKLSASALSNEIACGAKLNFIANIVDFNSRRVTGIRTPTSNNDAANKAYVDNAVSGTGSGDFKADGSIPATGDFNMASHKITALAEPTTTTDAATKQYVDSSITTAGDGKFLPLTGGELRGDIKIKTPDNAAIVVEGISGAGMVVSGGPIGGIPAGELIVQDSNQGNSSYIRLSATATGNEIACDSNLSFNANEVDFGNIKVTGIATPTANTDAANKAYVDNAVSSAGGGGAKTIYYKQGNLSGLTSLAVTFPEYNASNIYWCNIFISLYGNGTDTYNNLTMQTGGMLNRLLAPRLYFTGLMLNNENLNTEYVVGISVTLTNGNLRFNFSVPNSTPVYEGDYCITIQQLD